MRGVEFKGIRKDCKEWVYGYYFKQIDYVNLDGSVTEKYYIRKFCHSDYVYENTFETQAGTICEYTGMRTKETEQKIYEWDIFKSVNSTIGWIAKVGHQFVPLYKNKYGKTKRLSWQYVIAGEIIGNVSDNPKLIPE